MLSDLDIQDHLIIIKKKKNLKTPKRHWEAVANPSSRLVKVHMVPTCRGRHGSNSSVGFFFSSLTQICQEKVSGSFP